MAIRARGIVPAMSLLLAGCVSLGAPVPDQLFSLTAEARAPAGDLYSSPAAPAIVVLDPEVGRALDVTRVPVQVDESTIAYLQDAVWVDRPARLFRSVLAETIRARTRRLVIEAGEFDIKQKNVLTGRLLDMGYDARNQAVVVRFDAMLENAEGDVRSRRFEAVIAGVPAQPATVAPALNEAANRVAAEIAEWLGG
ncbi:MAG: ABC-type transport auxiliary lipoprotein family protein [Novosphingobium sp.]|nr:ABC-type transport auxiliary lipoprotein family protein [Novosphingobium sp.]